MEIAPPSTILNAKRVARVHKRSPIQPSKTVDQLHTSSEVKKKKLWVEKLKEMSDVRLEKIQVAYDTLENPSATYTIIAQKILN